MCLPREAESRTADQLFGDKQEITVWREVAFTTRTSWPLLLNLQEITEDAPETIAISPIFSVPYKHGWQRDATPLRVGFWFSSPNPKDWGYHVHVIAPNAVGAWKLLIAVTARKSDFIACRGDEATFRTYNCPFTQQQLVDLAQQKVSKPQTTNHTEPPQ